MFGDCDRCQLFRGTILKHFIIKIVRQEYTWDVQNLAECKVNAEQLARTPGAIGLLFDSLEYSRGSGRERFHIQYFGLQTLKSIFETNGAFCQHASLKLPNSITGPLKLLKDQEVLRNDSILLLQCLVYKSNIAQNIAVREGCLEEIFSIYE